MLDWMDYREALALGESRDQGERREMQASLEGLETPDWTACLGLMEIEVRRVKLQSILSRTQDHQERRDHQDSEGMMVSLDYQDLMAPLDPEGGQDQREKVAFPGCLGWMV